MGPRVFWIITFRFQHSGVFCITNEISFTIISLSSSDKFFLESGFFIRNYYYITNYHRNLGFLLGVAIILQIITGIFLALHYTSDLNSAYSSGFFFLLSQSRIWDNEFYRKCLLLHLVNSNLFPSSFHQPKCISKRYNKE